MPALPIGGPLGEQQFQPPDPTAPFRETEERDQPPPQRALRHGMVPYGSNRAAQPAKERQEQVTAGFPSAPPEFRDYFIEAEAAGGTPSQILEAIGYRETGGYQPDIVYGRRLSPKKARGMMQFLPDALTDVERITGKRYNPDDPKEAAEAASFYVSHLNKKYDGDWHKTIAAYNWGMGNLDRAIRNAAKTPHGNWILLAPKETRDYLEFMEPVIMALEAKPSATLAALDPGAIVAQAGPDKYQRSAPQLDFGRPGSDQPVGAQQLYEPSRRRALGGYGGMPSGSSRPAPSEFFPAGDPVKAPLATGGRGTVLKVGGKTLVRNMIGELTFLAEQAGIELGRDALKAIEASIAKDVANIPQWLQAERNAPWAEMGEGSVWANPSAIWTQFIENLPNTAATLGTAVGFGVAGRILGMSARAIAAIAGGIGAATEATIVGGAQYNQLRDSIEQATDTQLMEAPRYKELRDAGLSELDAKQELIEELAPGAVLPASGVSALLGGFGSAYLGKLVGVGRTPRMLGPTLSEKVAIRRTTAPGPARAAALGQQTMRPPGRAITTLKGAGVEGVTEAGQEGGETIFGNIAAAQSYDPGRPATEGLGESMAAGGGLGALMGAGPAALSPTQRQPPAAPPPVQGGGAAPGAAGPTPTQPGGRPSVPPAASAGPAGAGAAPGAAPASPAAVSPGMQPVGAAAAPAVTTPPPAAAAPTTEPTTTLEAAPESKRAFAPLDLAEVRRPLAALEPLKTKNGVAKTIRELVNEVREAVSEEEAANIPKTGRQRSADALAKLLVAAEGAAGETLTELAGDIRTALTAKSPGEAVKNLQGIIDKLKADRLRARAGAAGVEMTTDQGQRLAQGIATYDAEIEKLRREQAKTKPSVRKNAPAAGRATALEGLAVLVEDALNAAVTANPELKGVDTIRKVLREVKKAGETAMGAREKPTGKTQTLALPYSLSHKRQAERERVLREAAAKISAVLAGTDTSGDITVSPVTKPKAVRPKAEPTAEEKAAAKKKAEAKAEKKSERLKASIAKLKEKSAEKKAATAAAAKSTAATPPPSGEAAQTVAAAIRGQHESAKDFIAYAQTRPVAEVRGLAKSLGLKLDGNRRQLAKRIAEYVWTSHRTPPTTPTKKAPKAISKKQKARAAAVAAAPAATVTNISEKRFNARLDQIRQKLLMEMTGEEYLDDMIDGGVSPAQVSEYFWSVVYPVLPRAEQVTFERYVEQITGLQPSMTHSDLTVLDEQGNVSELEDWTDLATWLEKDLPVSAEHLEGIERGYVVLMYVASGRRRADVQGESVDTPLLSVVPTDWDAPKRAPSTEEVGGSTHYHGSKTKFTTLEQRDLGFHVGTPDQAIDRGPTLYTVEIAPETKALRVNDPVNGSWHDPAMALAMLRRVGVQISDTLSRRITQWRANADAVTDNPARNSTQMQLLTALRDEVRSKYKVQALVYRNKHEGTGEQDSLIILDPKIATIKYVGETTLEEAQRLAAANTRNPDMKIKPKVVSRSAITKIRDAGFGDMSTAEMRELVPEFATKDSRMLMGFVDTLTDEQSETFTRLRNRVILAETANDVAEGWLALSAWMEDINGKRVPDDVQRTVRDLVENLRNRSQQRLEEAAALPGEVVGEVVDEGEAAPALMTSGEPVSVASLKGIGINVTDEQLATASQDDLARYEQLLALAERQKFDEEMDAAGLSEEEQEAARQERFARDVGTAMARNRLYSEQAALDENMDRNDFELMQQMRTEADYSRDTNPFYFFHALNREEQSALQRLSSTVTEQTSRTQAGQLVDALRRLSRPGLFNLADYKKRTEQLFAEPTYLTPSDYFVDPANGFTKPNLYLNELLVRVAEVVKGVPALKAVVDQLVKLNLQQDVYFVDRMVDESGEPLRGAHLGAWYMDAVSYEPTNPAYNAIVIATSGGFSFDVIRAIIHEAVHSATVYNYDTNPEFNAAINEIFADAKAALQARGLNPNVVPGMNNAREMMAEALTNAEFQGMMATFRSTRRPKASLLWRMVGLIKEMLGLSPNHHSILDDIVRVTTSGFMSDAAQEAAYSELLKSSQLASTAKLKVMMDASGISNGRAVMDTLSSLKTQSTWSKFKDKMRDGWLSFHTLDQIQERYRRFFNDTLGPSNALVRYLDGIRAKRTLARKAHQEAEKINAKWRQLSPADDLAMSEAMQEATLWQIDPTKDFDSHPWLQSKKHRGRNYEAYNRVVDNYAALSADAKEVFQEVTTYFRKQRDQLRKTFLMAFVEQYAVDREWVARLMKLETTHDVENFIKEPGKVSQARMSTWGYQVGEEYRDRFAEDFGKNAAKAAKELKLIIRNSGIQGTYVPLRQFGDYVVTMSEDNFADFATQQEAADFAEDIEQQSPANSVSVIRQIASTGRWEVSYTIKHIEFVKDSGTATRRVEALTKLGHKGAQWSRKQEAVYTSTADSVPLFANLKNKFKDSPEIKGQLEVAFTEILASNAMRAAMLKREGYTGTDPAEMRRAFAERAYAGGWSMADIQTADIRYDALTQMNQDARDERVTQTDRDVRGRVLREIKLREGHDLADRKRSVMTDAITKTGFLWFLFSPAYSLINMTQPVMYTLPYLGGIYGNRNATREIGAAYKQVFGAFMQGIKATKGGLDPSKTADEFMDRILASLDDNDRGVIKTIRNMGLLDVTFMQEIADTAKGIEGTTFETIMQISRTLPQGVEVLNRVVTAVAAFRLAKAKGLDTRAAREAAIDTVRQTQFDYSMANRPRAFKFPGGRAVMLFKMFGQGVYNLLISNIYDALTGAGRSKAEARRILAGLAVTHTLTAGILGGIMLEPLRMLIGGIMMAFGDDDEPFDLDYSVRRFFTDTLGLSPTVAGLVTHGPARLSGAELFSRLGLHQLMYMGDFNLSTDSATLRTLASLVGPAGSMVLAPIDAGKRAIEGDWLGAIKQAMPAKVLRDLTASYELGMRGLSDRRGVNFASQDDFGFGAMFTQAVGFQPTKKAEVMMARRQVQNYDRFKTQRKQLLTTRWHRAGTPAARREIWRSEIMPFNRTIPDKERIKLGNLMRTMSERRAEAGDLLPERAKFGRERAAAYATP